jgi:hypothetical protein
VSSTSRPGVCLFRGTGHRLLWPLLCLPLLLTAQQSPHAGFLYPAGGRQGASIEIRLGGQFLNGASKAYVSGRGVEVKSVDIVKLPNGKETQLLREEQQKLNEKRAASFRPAPAGTEKAVFTEAEQKRLEEIRDQLDAWTRRQFIPALADTLILRIDIAPDASVGPRELRVETNIGITNPMVFEVGDLPEYARKPALVGPAFNVVNGGVPIIRTVAHEPDPPTDIKLPVVVNGQMMPATSDRYRFHAQKGQHVVIAAEARELIPYVSDAVPGWFQAAIALRDSQGKLLASADHFLFHPDPLLEFEIPSDGDYIAEIHDSIYRGREDFVYRLTIGELPVITSIFPLGGTSAGKPAARTAIQTLGWNLPAAKVVENFKGKPDGVYPVSLRNNGAASNPVGFTLDSLPEATAKSNLGVRSKAQRVKLPVVIDGRIAKPGEPAFFRFEGRAGEQIVAEVTARRLGSPLDSILRLTDQAGKELAFNDDFEDRGAGLITHQSDSFLSFKLPAKGTYYLQLADTQQKGGPDYGYRLRISEPRPDYELRVVPSTFNIRSGATVPFTVYALRRDGFAGEIALKLKDAPTNFVLSGAAVPSGQDHVRLTLTVPKTPGAQPLSIQMTGQANIDGRPVMRSAVPAEDMEQAFAYHHIVARDTVAGNAWLVRVIGTGASTPYRTVDKPVALRSGADTAFVLPIPSARLPGVELILNDPPEGITLQKVTPDRDGISVLVEVQADKAKPGLKGNLILDAYREAANPGAGVRQARRQPMGTLPAVPFEVVGPTLQPVAQPVAQAK